MHADTDATVTLSVTLSAALVVADVGNALTDTLNKVLSVLAHFLVCS